MGIYVDATTLIALGTVGELVLLMNFDGRLAVPEAVVKEVTLEPARSNLEGFLRREAVERLDYGVATNHHVELAKELLDEESVNGDVHLIAAFLEVRGGPISTTAVVSDDRRVRTVAESLGATVTGTIGVVVRAVHEGMDPDEAKDLVRRLDSQGLHMTGELRETAYRLVDEAAKEREK